MHPPGSGFAAVPAFFSREFQVTPGSGGRLRSGPGNEGMSLALFASAVFLNPQRQQATSSACLQGLVLHHGKLWSDRLDEVGGLAHFSGGSLRLLSTASLERGTRHSPTICHELAPARGHAKAASRLVQEGAPTLSSPARACNTASGGGTATSLKMKTNGTEVWFQFEYTSQPPSSVGL